MNLKPFALFIIVGCLTVNAFAQTDDDFISALPSDRLSVSLHYDVMKKQYDVFKINDRKLKASYRGQHIDAKLKVHDYFYVSGSYWQREVDATGRSMEVKTWHVSGIVPFFTHQKTGLSLATRLSYSENEGKSFSHGREMSGYEVQFHLNKPRDEKKQLDFIVSYPFTAGLSGSAYISLGQSNVSYASYQTTALDSDKCLYDITFDLENHKFDGLMRDVHACSATSGVSAITGAQLTDNQVKLATSLQAENLRYKSNYRQVGGSLNWRYKAVELKGAYRFNQQSRKGIDKRIRQNGDRTVKSNHILTGQVAYHFVDFMSVSFTARYLHNQFTGEIPFLYNGATAKHFKRHFGLISLGIHARIK